MKAIKHLFLAILTLAALASGAWPQASDSTAPAPRKKHKPVAAAPAPPAITAADIQALKDGLAAQQQQIQQLTQQLKQAKQNGQQAQAAAADAANKAAAVQTQASQQQQTVVELKSDVADLKTSATNAALTLQETEKNFSAFQSPTTLHIKGISITPGGFAEALDMERGGALKGGEILLGLLQRQGRVGGGRLEVGHVALQLNHRLLLLAGLGLHGRGLVSGVGRGGLRLLPVLLRLLQLLRELLDLLLLGGQAVFQRLNVGSGYSRRRWRRGYGLVLLPWSGCGRVRGLWPSAACQCS